jgi:POT family proton-dependent oligopeptide transporter
VLVWWWLRLSRKGRQPSPIVKMATGAAIMGLSYLMLAAEAWFADAHGVKAASLWLIAFLVLLTIGELWILPIGLGLFGRLAPEGIGALTIAIWFFAISLGSFLGGQLGVLWSRIGHAEFFTLMAAMSFVAGALLLVFDRPARRLEAGAEVDLSALHLEG